MKGCRSIAFSCASLNLKKTNLTKLTNRSLLILNGPDCRKLLQGLTTNDVRELKQITQSGFTSQRVALYSLFLQPKGKLLTDAFIFQPRLYRNGSATYPKDELWIDVPTEGKKQLKEHLLKHMWRKDAQLHDVQEGDDPYKPQIYAGYNEETTILQQMLGGSVELEELKKGEDDTYSNLIFFDPRGANFGVRIISMQPDIAVEGNLQNKSQEQFDLIYQSIGQVPYEHTHGKLPFQFNYDLMNAISLKKGCFLGQEIISRGLLAGIIRRRTFPFLLSNKQEVLAIGSVIKTEQGQELGKIIISSKGRGVALINYISLLEKQVAWPIKFVHPVEGVLQNPFQDRLAKYYAQMKGKQKILQELDL